MAKGNCAREAGARAPGSGVRGPERTVPALPQPGPCPVIAVTVGGAQSQPLAPTRKIWRFTLQTPRSAPRTRGGLVPRDMPPPRSRGVLAAGDRPSCPRESSYLHGPPVWQHPFLNVFRHFKVGEWKRSTKEGDVAPVTVSGEGTWQQQEGPSLS